MERVFLVFFYNTADEPSHIGVFPTREAAESYLARQTLTLTSRGFVQDVAGTTYPDMGHGQIYEKMPNGDWRKTEV